MGSPFETQFARQASQLRNAFGTPNSVYTPPNNTAPTTGLTVRVQRDDPREVMTTIRSSGEIQTADIIVLQADLPRALPGGRFTVDGLAGQEVWTIDLTPLAQNGEFICKCSQASTNRLMPRRAKE